MLHQHLLPGFPWRLCKTSTMVLCTTTRCRQEKGGDKARSGVWMGSLQSFRSFITLPTTLSLHLHPWHAQVDIILGLPMLTYGSERSPLTNAWVTSHVVAETHWGSRVKGSFSPHPAPCRTSRKPCKLKPAAFPSCCGDLFPLTFVLPKAQNLPVKWNVIS